MKSTNHNTTTKKKYDNDDGILQQQLQLQEQLHVHNNSSEGSRTDVLPRAMTNTNTTTTTPTTLREALQEAIALLMQEDGNVDNSANATLAVAAALPRLLHIQTEIARLAMFSTGVRSSELLNELPTSSLPFLSLEHYLALGYARLPMTALHIDDGGFDLSTRLQNLIRASDLWSAFLHRLDQLEFAVGTPSSTDSDKKRLELLTEWAASVIPSSLCSSNSHDTKLDVNPLLPSVSLLAPSRDDKIAQYKARQASQRDVARLQALVDRRRRFNVADDDSMDGFDDYDALERQLHLSRLRLHQQAAAEEWTSVLREIPMIQGMAERDHERQLQQARYHSSSRNNSIRAAGLSSYPQQQQQQRRPLQLTQITKDPVTGQLIVQHPTRQDIQSTVFRPGWNLPTMSLDELAEREVQQAIQRAEQQDTAEVDRRMQARRFEFLERDGLEDDADLVDAAAPLDRSWDDWKDDNPRGSGNKRGNVGDRNF